MDSKTPVKVVCGIIWKDDKVFIARRKPGKSLGGFWEFPGGKIETNETAEKALIRELKEELDMEIRIKNYFGSNTYVYDSVAIELIAFVCDFVSSTYDLKDHDKYEFLSPEKLLALKIAPADLFIIEKLLTEFAKKNF